MPAISVNLSTDAIQALDRLAYVTRKNRSEVVMEAVEALIKKNAKIIDNLQED